MSTQPPDECPSAELPAAVPPTERSQPSADPPSAPPPSVDWPDRSHFSEFDQAIEAQLATSEDRPPAAPPRSAGSDDAALS